MSTLPTAPAASAAALLTPTLLTQAMTYAEYRALTAERFAAGRTTSADPYFNTPDKLEYTRLNLARMARLDVQPSLAPETEAVARALPRPVLGLVLVESWCGDAAQIVPVIQRLADASGGRLTLRYLLRDEHPTLMDHFLTNGGRAIPKMILLDPDTRAVLGSWGPRPAEGQELLRRSRAAGETHDQFTAQLHAWYARDKTQAIQREMRALLTDIADRLRSHPTT